jgi:[protein-PII] uridylyltransferase
MDLVDYRLAPNSRPLWERGFSSAVPRGAFLVGMPPEYYAAHDETEIWAHSRIVERRGEALVTVEPCPGPDEPAGAHWLCVVADDRPGLLSLVAAAMSANSLDVLGARIYVRSTADDVKEAVDLFAVRGLRDTVGLLVAAEVVARIRRTLEGLLSGTIELDNLEHHAVETWRPRRLVEPAVWFEEEADCDLVVVETTDRPGLLLAISLALFHAGVTVLRSHVSTVGAVAHDEFALAEFDGRPLTRSRRDAIEQRLRSVVSFGRLG